MWPAKFLWPCSTASRILGSWLSDGYSLMFRSYVFGPLGLKDYGSATLHCKILSLPFLGLRPHTLHTGAMQGKEGIKFCHLVTLPRIGQELGVREESFCAALLRQKELNLAQGSTVFEEFHGQAFALSHYLVITLDNWKPFRLILVA